MRHEFYLYALNTSLYTNVTTNTLTLEEDGEEAKGGWYLYEVSYAIKDSVFSKEERLTMTCYSGPYIYIMTLFNLPFLVLVCQAYLTGNEEGTSNTRYG